MSSRNYRRGYDAEKLLCTILEGAGRNMWVERFHASKGTFDLIASDHQSLWLVQVKRSKRRIVSLTAVASAFKDDILRMQRVTAPRKCVLKILALYIDRQPGESRGTWRTFVVKDHVGIEESPLLEGSDG